MSESLRAATSFSMVAKVPPQRFLPHASSHMRSASAESHVGVCTPFVTCVTGTSVSGHLGKQALEESSTDLTVQSTDAIDSATAPDRQIGHIERFGRILAISSPKREKVLERNR